MELILTRFCYSSMGTFGKLEGLNLSMLTIEDPWHNNEPNNSCIPDGPYTAKRTHRPKHGNTFVLINEDLKIAEYPKPGMRSSCLIHIANTILDVEGCIGLGERLGCLGSNWAILDSGIAINRFMQHVENEQEFELKIIQGKGAK